MLLAQTPRTLFSAISLSPKIEVAGVSLGGEVKREANKGLVTDTLKLLKYLEKRDSIVELTTFTTLTTHDFYHSEGEWHYGVFYFATITSVVATYLLWTTLGSSIILLAGSPANIIGQNTPKEGITISSTGDAMHTVGSGSFLKALKTDEETFGPLSGFGRPQQEFTFVEWVYMHERSRAAPMAMFCFRYLSKLPLTAMDTMFKVFSILSSRRSDCLADIRAERERQLLELDKEDSTKQTWERGLEHRAWVQERWNHNVVDAENFHLDQYKTVYIGSPIYTALA